MKQTMRTRKMVEASLLVALATVLSILKIAELPYGGSITLASMFPILLLSYRHGMRWGLGGGMVYGVLQQLIGLNNLTYFTTWRSIVAIICLDYLIAFAVVGLGGVFRRVQSKQSISLALGAIFVCVLRYLCHVVSGATVWAGLSIPDGAAIGYSLIYNATYMIPETVVLVAVSYYLGSLIDFRRDQPTRLAREQHVAPEARVFSLLAGVFALLGVVVDVSLIFPRLQNAETGKFDLSGLAVTGGLADSFWLPVIIVSAVCALACTALLVARAKVKHTEKHD